MLVIVIHDERASEVGPVPVKGGAGRGGSGCRSLSPKVRKFCPFPDFLIHPRSQAAGREAQSRCARLRWVGAPPRSCDTPADRPLRLRFRPERSCVGSQRPVGRQGGAGLDLGRYDYGALSMVSWLNDSERLSGRLKCATWARSGHARALASPGERALISSGLTCCLK